MARSGSDKTNFYRCFIMAWAVVLVLGWGAVPALAGETAGETRIRFYEKAVVKGDRILLGEVARIRADDFIKEEMASISLGASPKPGRSLSLSKSRIESLLGSEPLIHSDVRLEIPKRIYVKRSGREPDRAELQKVFERFLSDYYSGKVYKLKSFSFRGTKAYPEGEMRFVPDTAHNPGADGNLSLHVDVMIDGKKADRINLRGRVAVYENFACARRALKRGDKIQRRDVYFAQKDIFRVRGEYARTFDELENKTVMSTVNKGDGFKLNLLKESPLILKGEVVKLVARKQNLLIETQGICREDGFVNKPVKVENLSSGKLVRGMVNPSAVVEVLF